MASIYEKDRVLVEKIREFIDLTSTVNLIFPAAVRNYLCCAQTRFEEDVERIRALESQGDILRRGTEVYLYSEKLIPESRGDVLGLIESVDEIIDEIKKTMLLFAVEMPEIPAGFQTDYIQLSDTGAQAVDAVMVAARIFFQDPWQVQHLIQKVYELEKKADQQAAALKRQIFRVSDLPLCKRMHLRYFAYHIDLIADRAEDVADRLAIAAIKQVKNE